VQELSNKDNWFLYSTVLSYYHKERKKELEDKPHSIISNGSKIAIVTQQYKVVFLEPKLEELEVDNKSSFLKSKDSDTSREWEQDILFGKKNRFNKSFNLTLLDFPVKTEIAQMSIGLSHYTMIDRDFRAYAFGDNSMFQLGLEVRLNS
jgi:alpha-tubulin suppressor-like RCC1 family protein